MHRSASMRALPSLSPCAWTWTLSSATTRNFEQTPRLSRWMRYNTDVRRRPLGVTMISALYLVASAGYTALLFAWLFARDMIATFIEEATPSASLGPTLLLSVPGIVTTYFVGMAILCCWIGIALRKLQRWAWFVACGFAILSFVLDITLFVHML